MGFPPRSACLQISGQTHIKCDSFIAFIWQRSWMCVWTEIILWSCSPMKVLEMYSDTWLPERLISDRWDSSLFSILLNCSTKQRCRSAMCDVRLHCGDTTARLSTVWIMTLLLQIKNNAFLISYDEKQHKYIYDVCWSENPGNHNGISYFHIIRDEVILSCLYVG